MYPHQLAVIVTLVPACIVGDAVGEWVGNWVGVMLGVGECINFAVAKAKLTTASQRLCNYTPSGTMQVTSWGAITLTGGNQLSQVHA
jgi:hypothetical protein